MIDVGIVVDAVIRITPVAGLVTDGEGGGLEGALLEVEVDELVGLGRDGAVERVVLHHAPTGERAGVAGLLETQLRHIGARHVEAGTDDQEQGDDCCRAHRERAATRVAAKCPEPCPCTRDQPSPAGDHALIPRAQCAYPYGALSETA
jgi:hypothetical protein